MNGRRAGAFLIAAVLIAGAWVVRTQVIDSDDASSGGSGTTSVICVTELAEICNAVLVERKDITVTIESVNNTLDRLGADAVADDLVWVTMQPFPAMVDSLRVTARLDPLEISVDRLASSPLTLVVAADRAESLATTCGDPAKWDCIGRIANEPWSAVDPSAAAGLVRPAFAPHPDTAIGQLGVASAVLGFFGDAPITSGDTGFITWTRNLAGASEPPPPGQTAIQRLQVRSSVADIAVGAAAELNDLADARFVLLAPEGASTVDVIAAGLGTNLSGDVTAALTAALVDAGWNQPATAGTDLAADDMLLIRTLWKDLT